MRQRCHDPWIVYTREEKRYRIVEIYLTIIDGVSTTLLIYCYKLFQFSRNLTAITLPTGPSKFENKRMSFEFFVLVVPTVLVVIFSRLFVMYQMWVIRYRLVPFWLKFCHLFKTPQEISGNGIGTGLRHQNQNSFTVGSRVTEREPWSPSSRLNKRLKIQV